ncbi:MAG: hypothetical protein AAGC47_11200 [Bacteroidota bacterium]
MVRNIINVVVLGGLVVFAFYWFSKDFENPVEDESDTLLAIPSSAALIFECSDLADVWRDLSGESAVWSELLATEYFFRLNTLGENLDSLIRNDSKLRGLIASKPIAISAHLTGGEEYGFLFAMQLDIDAAAEDVSSALGSTFRIKEEQSRTYDGEQVFSFESPFFDSRLFYFIKDGMLVFSLSEVLIEESIRTLVNDGSVLDKKEFLMVRNTIDRSARGHLYINYQPLKTIVSSYVTPTGQKSNLFKNPFADWSALDLDIENNALSMNGFVMASDSSKAWLDAFAKMKAPRVELLDYLPSNTAYFTFLGFGDFEDYMAQKVIKLEKNGELFRFKKKAAEWDEACGCSSEDLGLSWISSQAISFISEPSSKDYSQNVFAAFMTEDPEGAEELLRDFASFFSEEESREDEDQIFALPVGNFYSDMIGSAFSELENPYATRVEDAIVMANSENALRNYLNGLSSGRSFTSSLAYEGIENQLFNEANLVLYSSLAKSPFILQDILKEEHAESIENQVEVLRQFESFVYQISHSSGELYYNNLFLKQGSNYAQETGTIWELKLKASAIGKGHLLENHYTGVLETLVQDDENRIYLISNNGKVIWDRMLDAPLLGDVKQIDVYKNKKLQMLFSTEKSIYLVDRNGNDVESYPINLPSVASAEVSVADYDRSRDYRIFIPVEGNDVLCFDVLGKAVKGWKYNGGEGEIVEPIQHLRIKRKDYLFSITDDGRVLLLNRKGDIRHKVETRLGSFQKGTTQLELGDKISTSSLSYADSDGTAYRLKFDDGKEQFQPRPEATKDYFFTQLNDEESLDFCFLYDKSVSAYSFAGDILFEIDAASSETSSIAFHKVGKARFISLTNPDKEEISLYNASGELVTGFPVFGYSEPSIGDINLDGYLELVVTGKDGSVYAYSIEQE